MWIIKHMDPQRIPNPRAMFNNSLYTNHYFFYAVLNVICHLSSSEIIQWPTLLIKAFTKIFPYGQLTG